MIFKRLGRAALCLIMLIPLQSRAAFFDDDEVAQKLPAGGVSFEAIFTARTASSPAIVKLLTNAKTSIRVSAHDFSSKPVAEAIIKAQRANVDTKVLLDGKQSALLSSNAQFLITMNLTPHKPGKPLRSDYIVIDGRDIVLGNLVDLADTEEEKSSLASVLIIHDAPDLAKRYLADWQANWDGSTAIAAQK